MIYLLKKLYNIAGFVCLMNRAYVIQNSFNCILAGDVGFDEREILRDTSHLEDPLYKNPDVSGGVSMEERDKTLTNDSRGDKSMDIDLEPPVVGDGFGDGVGGGFMGNTFFPFVVGCAGLLYI